MELVSHDCYSEGKIKLGRPIKERTKWVLGSWLLSLLARCTTLLGMLGNVYFWLFWITACNSFSCGLTTLRNNWREYLFCIPSSPDCYPLNLSWEKLWVLCLASPLSCAVFGAQHKLLPGLREVAVMAISFAPPVGWLLPPWMHSVVSSYSDHLTEIH